MNNRLYQYRRDAARRGHAFLLGDDEAMGMFVSRCHYCGREPYHWYRQADRPYNGIDRMNPKIGYETGNVVPCCKACNRLKGSLQYDEFVEIMAQVGHLVSRRFRCK